MNSEIKSNLKAAGIDVEGALGRLMNNEAFYEKILKKFEQDQNMYGLLAALKEKNYEDAFHFAHTLKGLSGNLGMTRLMQADIVIVEKLRSGEEQDFETELKEVEEAYEAVLAVIHKMG